MTAVAVHITASENLRRTRRKGSYHLVASRNKLPEDEEDEDEDPLFRYLTSTTPGGSTVDQPWRVQDAKQHILKDLARTRGDSSSPAFLDELEELSEWFEKSSFDVRTSPSTHGKTKALPQLEGMWISLSKPNFPGCLGLDKNNEFMYTLGRMSFDMFRPSKLVCSIQGSFNPIHELDSKKVLKMDRVPKLLKKEVQDGHGVLRSYDVVTAFTIEPQDAAIFGPQSPNQHVRRPIKGLMTTYGYALSNPEEPHRLAIWFTGGSIEALDEYQEDWNHLFGSDMLPKRHIHEHAHLFGAKVLMGAVAPGRMEEDGKMSYCLQRPIGGHDKAFVDVLYMDETFRVVRASSGVIHVFARVPSFPDE